MKKTPARKEAAASMRPQTKTTILFLFVLLLAGIFHALEHVALQNACFFFNTFLFIANLMTYSGLILFWLISVRKRLLPTRARTNMLISGTLMILFLLIRAMKYRIGSWSFTLSRMCWYLYYAPIILIPTLFLMISLDCGNTAAKQSRFRKYLPFPALLLTCGILTNDLHHMAFDIGTADWKEVIEHGSYTYGALFFAAEFWASCMMAAGVAHLISVSRQSRQKKQMIRPLLFLLLTAAVLITDRILEKTGLPNFYMMPELLIFCLIAVQESCIRNRLLPHNENYEAFFPQLDLPLMLTDSQLDPVCRTAIPVTAEKEQLQKAAKHPVYPDPDTRLSGLPLPAGYAFFTEDESILNRLNEELQDANEVLALENELLVREQELIAEKAAIEERNLLYTKAEKEVYPARKRIAEILDHTQPETPSFRRDIAGALALTAYVKRKANFVMIEAERETMMIEELAAALQESAHYFGYCGMHTTVSITAKSDFPCRTATALYDSFEAAAEALCGRTEELWLRLSDTELLMLADTEHPVTLPPLSLPASCDHADGQTVIRIAAGGDSP